MYIISWENSSITFFELKLNQIFVHMYMGKAELAAIPTFLKRMPQSYRYHNESLNLNLFH